MEKCPGKLVTVEVHRYLMLFPGQLFIYFLICDNKIQENVREKKQGMCNGILIICIQKIMVYSLSFAVETYSPKCFYISHNTSKHNRRHCPVKKIINCTRATLPLASEKIIQCGSSFNRAIVRSELVLNYLTSDKKNTDLNPIISFFCPSTFAVLQAKFPSG